MVAPPLSQHASSLPVQCLCLCWLLPHHFHMCHTLCRSCSDTGSAGSAGSAGSTKWTDEKLHSHYMEAYRQGYAGQTGPLQNNTLCCKTPASHVSVWLQPNTAQQPRRASDLTPVQPQSTPERHVPSACTVQVLHSTEAQLTPL